MYDIPQNLPLAKKLNTGATIVSIVVVLLVVMMRKIKIDAGIDFSFLPPFYSALNALVAFVLILALSAIKKNNVGAHRRYMTVALGLSFLFLVCYVVYHITTPETKYCNEGNIRYLYFFLLITHIILAALLLPFILFTYIRAYTGQIMLHRKMAKWVFPLWLYVAVTGPIIYIMLRPCYLLN